MIEQPSIWKEMANHLAGSHHNLIILINKHTDMIIKLQDRVKGLEDKLKNKGKSK